MKNFRQIKAVLAGLLLSSAVMPVALADDIEIYTSSAAQAAAKNPNIMFIVDNSVSMAATSEVRAYYVHTQDYAGACQRDGIYFIEPGQAKPDCTATPAPDNWFNRSARVCSHAIDGYDANGVIESPREDASLRLFGHYSDQFAHYDTTATPKRWRELAIGDTADRDFQVECLADSGIHGDGPGVTSYIVDDDADGFTSTVPDDTEVPHLIWAAGNANLVLYDGNYLNYENLPDTHAMVGLIEKTRLEQVQRAVEIMVRSNTRVNIGLMLFDDSDSGGVNSRKYDGGGILYGVQDVVAPRTNFFTALKTIQPTAHAQLSESYYEALLYYGGKEIDFGDNSNPPVTGEAKDGGTGKYLSPISSSCDANYIVVLSGGVPTADDVNTPRNDDDSVNRLAGLAGFPTNICNTTVTEKYAQGGSPEDLEDDNLDVDGTDADGNPSTVHNCLDELAEWAQTNDVLVDVALKPETLDDQNIFTHTIGFDIRTAYVAPENQDPPVLPTDLVAYAAAEIAEEERVADAISAYQLLDLTAEKGGGRYYKGDSTEELVTIFDDIVTNALKVHTTFSSPAVSVNAFNRSTHLDDLYFTLFRPSATQNAWEGNLKKYKLKFSTNPDTGGKIPFVADVDDNDAVDHDTGFFADTSQSYWSTEVDGKYVQKGGAAGALTNTRNVYTITGDITDADTNGVYEPAEGDLTNAVNAVVDSDELTDALLNTAGRTPIVDAIPYRTTMIDWAKGLDVFSDYGAVDTTADARLRIGDPLHAEPALVQYGLEGVPAHPDLVAYVSTNDGYLHAFDVDDGTELFSFIPQELLGNLPVLMENAGGNKTYGLDGGVVAWIYDHNGDNSINAADGDHVYLYISMRRGGRYIYAVDVTTRNSPALKWIIKGGTGDYTKLGETWSNVNVEKIKDGTTEKTVLIFGGGYDATQDNTDVRRVDSVGGTVFIADAASGARLWSASENGAASVTMDYGVPARIKPLDISGDGLIDRLYAADMGGQIFRFDINNASGLLVSSISGGRIADLAGSVAADARRFYYPPDVALIDAPDGKYHALVISSGFRAHPLVTTVHDRIYMLKDRNTGLLTSNAAYKYQQGLLPGDANVLGPLTEASLEDVTTNLAGGEGITGVDVTNRDAELGLIKSAEGWYIDLDDESNPGTWIGEKGLAEPLILEGVAIVSTFTPTEPSEDGCSASTGLGKVFYLDIMDATAAFPSDADVRSERHVVLKRGGIPPSPNVIITTDGEAGCNGTECDEINLDLGVRKTYWYEVN